MSIVIEILNVVFLLGLSWLIFTRQSSSIKKLYWPALLLKVLCGCAVGAVYFFFYDGVGDTIGYHRDGTVLAQVARDESFMYYLSILFSNAVPQNLNLLLVAPRALFFSKMVSVFSLFTADNYWIICAYFSLISFFASWYLVKTITVVLPRIAVGAALAFLFFPSVVFWTSGIIKESIACASLFVVTDLFLRIWFKTNIKWQHAVLSLFSLYLLWALKYHYAAIFVAVVAAMFVFRYLLSLREFNFTVELLLWILVLILPITLITFLHPNFNTSRFLSVVVENNHAFALLSSPEDLIHFSELSPTITSILKNSPLALFSGLFRPLLWEAGNLFQYVAGLENLFVILLFISACFGVRQIVSSKHLPLTLGVITFIIILAVFICLSTPNFGTLSRYRVGYEPYFISLILSTGPLARLIERKLQFLV
jgi:hypothetical protein